MGNAYLGWKASANLCQPLIAMMPSDNLYIETHMGGDARLAIGEPDIGRLALDILLDAVDIVNAPQTLGD